ncbi:MAG: response regulator [Burkholderiaceae bacterium]
MDLKQALIVDDSKSAQHILARMLERFDLRSDVAFSAQEALAYLSHHHPAVIFLDENMPGMNGIEALKTIKSNPNTALIPVIMYTSADDDVFVTQARALGALDILSKSNMQPESLARVLTSLKIFPASDKTTNSTTETDANIARQKPKSVEIEPTTELTDLEKVSRQISRLFEIHITAVREQINNSAQFVTKRVISNLEKNSTGLSGQHASGDAQNGASNLEVTTIEAKQALLAEKQKYSFVTQTLLSALLLGVLWAGYQLFRISNDLETASSAQLAVMDTKKQDAQHIANTVIQLMDDKNSGKDSNKVAISNPATLKAMVWLQNTDFQYNFNEQPLNDAQIINLATLTRILADAGYAGVITVNINFGNFCLETVAINNINTWRLAASDTSASECKQLKDLNPKFAATDYATPAFRNFERNLASQHDGRITVRLVSNGIAQPRADYPLITSSTMAGEWNNAAARNNRLGVQLSN